MKILVLINIIFFITGCSTFHAGTISDSVRLMNKDCANFKALENYYLENISLEKPYLQAQDDYEKTISYYKNNLWNLRYSCYPRS